MKYLHHSNILFLILMLLKRFECIEGIIKRILIRQIKYAPSLLTMGLVSCYASFKAKTKWLFTSYTCFRHLSSPPSVFRIKCDKIVDRIAVKGL